MPDRKNFEIKTISNDEIGNFLNDTNDKLFHNFRGFYEDNELKFIVKIPPGGLGPTYYTEQQEEEMEPAWVLVAQEEVPDLEDFEIKEIPRDEIGNFLVADRSDLFHNFRGLYEDGELEFILKVNPSGSLIFYVEQ